LNNLDLVELLGLIRMSMFTGATSKDTVHSWIDAMEKCHSFKQTSCMDNATYLQTFQSHLGVHMWYIKAWIQDAGGDLDNVAVWEQTKNEI
jgi:hypothetical protein